MFGQRFKFIAGFPALCFLSALAAMAQSAPGALAQTDEATIVQGLDSSGLVRTCNLANLEALMNVFANGVELVSILYASWLLVRAISKPDSKMKRFQKISVAVSIMGGGLSVPSLFNFTIATARDWNLFY